MSDYPDQPMCPNCVTPWKCNGPHIPEDSELAALRSKVAEARAEGMEEAAKVCDEVAANPSPMWEEAEYCWEHAAKDCAAAIRAKMKEVK